MKLYNVYPEYLTLWGSDCTEDTIITEDQVRWLSEEWETPVDELLEQLRERDDLLPIVTILTNGNKWDRQVIYYNTNDRRMYSDHDAEPLNEGIEYETFDEACKVCGAMYLDTIGWEPEWIADQN